MKTTSFLKGLAFAAAAMFFGACQQLYIETQPEVEIKMSTDVRESYTFSGTNPQPATFSIASTTPWEITGYEAADWLSVKPASSALSSLSADVTLTAAPNETYEARTATLTLKGEGIDKVWTIQLTQGMKSKFYVQPISEEFAGSESSHTFAIETNLAWEVRSADAWLTFDKTSGTGTGAIETITATAAENPGVERTTTVTVTAGAEVETFTVLQKGGKTLEILTTEIEMLSYAGGEVLLDVNASMDWTVASSAEWLTVEKVGAQVKATAAPNTVKFAARSAVVTIAGDGLTAEVEISQDVAYEFSGSCEVLEDGSVLISGDGNGQVTLKERLTHFSVVLEVSDLVWSSAGQFWFLTTEGGDFGNWMVQGKMRLRDYHFQSSNVYYDDKVNEDLLKSMTTYEFAYEPERLYFGINGQEIAHYDMPECWFSEARPDLGGWWFGFHKDVNGAGTSYIVKSCTVTPIAE